MHNGSIQFKCSMTEITEQVGDMNHEYSTSSVATTRMETTPRPTDWMATTMVVKYHTEKGWRECISSFCAMAICTCTLSDVQHVYTLCVTCLLLPWLTVPVCACVYSVCDILWPEIVLYGPSHCHYSLVGHVLAVAPYSAHALTQNHLTMPCILLVKYLYAL